MFVKQLQKAEEYIEQHWKIFLSAVFVLQVFIIIINFSVYGIQIYPDTSGYVAPALSFLRSGKMLDPAGAPILIRTPGYPLLLALIYGCFGQNNLVVVIIQKIMIIAITGMIFSGVSQFANHAAGVLASWFYVMDYVIYSSSSSILTDTPFSFFVTLGAYGLLRYLKTQKMPYLILCYAAVNYALLVRPNIMYLNMILFFVLLFLSLFKKIPWKKTLPYLLMFLVAYGGWSLRNAAYYGKPVYTPIRDNSAYADYAPRVYALEDYLSRRYALDKNVYDQNVYLKEARAAFAKELASKYPDFDSMDPLAQVAARKEIGTAYIRKHIPGYILLNVIGLFKEMLAPNAYYITHLPLPGIFHLVLLAVTSGMLAFCYVFYAVSFLANIRKQTWLDWLLLFSTLYFMASTAVIGYSRFRVAFYPVCVMGAFLCWRSRLTQIPSTKPADD